MKTNVVISVSLNPKLIEKARARAQELGFENSFSAYMGQLLRKDVEPQKNRADPRIDMLDRLSAIASLLPPGNQGAR